MGKMPDGRPVKYIGDGVYAILDGYGIVLHANHYLNPTDRIYLEPNVLANLNLFMEKCNRDRKIESET